MDHTRNYLAPNYTAVYCGDASVMHYRFYAQGSSVYKITEVWRGRIVHWGLECRQIEYFSVCHLAQTDAVTFPSSG